jgi:hypothetical protein
LARAFTVETKMSTTRTQVNQRAMIMKAVLLTAAIIEIPTRRWKLGFGWGRTWLDRFATTGVTDSFQTRMQWIY